MVQKKCVFNCPYCNLLKMRHCSTLVLGNQVGVVEECLAFYSLLDSKLRKKGGKTGDYLSIQEIVDDSIPTDKAYQGGIPEDQWSFGTNVCVLCLQYLDNDGQFELAQLGAVVFHYNTKAKEVYFASCLPPSAESDQQLMMDLGLTRQSGH